MAPIPVWSGNLRLSLVLVPVRLFPATSSEGTIAFRMIHKPSGKPIKYLKGVETEQGFEEVPEEEIIKGYEHTKGHHVLIKPEEIDALKLEAKHTIDMARFVDLDEIDSRYFEKPYYLLPDGDKRTKAMSSSVMRWRRARRWQSANSSCMAASIWSASPRTRRDLMLVILRYADELRKPEPYFDKIEAKADADAVKLATDLIEQESGKFQPEKMPNEYARAVHELVQAKIEQRAPEVEIETAKGESPKVINIMDALKKSMQAKGQTKVKDAVRKRMGKAAPKRSASPLSRVQRDLITPDCALAFTSADKLPAHFDAETQRIRLHIGLDQGFVTEV